MVPLAPRYDPRILELVRLLDDRSVPLAEVSRRVGEAALRIGLFKPSYVHLRRVILAERERRDAVREVVSDVANRVFAARYVNAYEVAARLDAAGAAPLSEWLVAQSHKVVGVDGVRRRDAGVSRRPGGT